MTRKRIKHEQIQNESKRNAVFRKRVEGLLKKANELSTLCGVDMAIIIKGGENINNNDNNPILWPSAQAFRERLQKFMNFSNFEIAKKMVTKEKYMEQTLSAEAGNLLKSKKINEVKETQHLIDEAMKGMSIDDVVDISHLNGLNLFLDEMVNKLEETALDGDNDVVNNNNEEGQQLPTVLLENMKNDGWFIDTMAERQEDVAGFFEVPWDDVIGGETSGAAASGGGADANN